MMRALFLIAVLATWAGCTADVIEHDLVRPDAGDAEPSDAGRLDAASPGDAAIADAEPSDAEPSDASIGACRLAPAHDFFEIVAEVGTSATDQLEVVNRGDAPCVISSLRVDPPEPFTLGAVGATVLEPGETLSIGVTFSPTAQGTVQATLHISSNAAEPELALPITGVAGPREIASRQTVTIHVTNRATADRYLVTDGFFCAEFATTLPTRFGFQCRCECPNPGGPRAHVFRRLAPGESWDLGWDGRALLTYRHRIDCAALGWPGAPGTELLGSRQPVAPGFHTIEVAYELAPPADCGEPQPGEWECPLPVQNGQIPPAVAELCPSTFTASQSFELPASGDVVVNFDLP